MYPYQIEQMASQHETEMRTAATRTGGTRRARPGRPTHPHRHPARRRWTLIGSLRAAS
jgi:hypothetical protein